MKIEYIYINGYKNLNDVEMYFDEGSSVNSIIGNNGSGKSNILEAIAIIFSNALENINNLDFRFCIKYSLDSQKIEISNINNLENKIEIKNNDKKILINEIRTILPKNVFLYYAGETKRLKDISEVIVDKIFNKNLKKEEKIVLRFLTYLSVDDFGPSLLVNHIYKNELYKKICELVPIQDIFVISHLI